MKKLILSALICSTIVLTNCKKSTVTTEPASTALTTSPIPTLKTVKIVINKGGLNQFTHIRWSFVPLKDSSYNSYNNGYVRTYINTTYSDSILLYSTSADLTALITSDQIFVYVNGYLKHNYSGISTNKKLYLN